MIYIHRDGDRVSDQRAVKVSHLNQAVDRYSGNKDFPFFYLFFYFGVNIPVHARSI